MNENEARAKEIFLKYAGDVYQMEREGELDDYRALSITSAEEQVWANEFEKTLIDCFCQAGVVDAKVVTFMKLVKDFDSFAEFLAFLSVVENKAPSLDTFTKVRLCEEILDTASFLEKEKNHDKNVLRRAREVVFKLVKLIQNEPITVNPYYRTVPHLPEALGDNRLRQRIDRLVTDADFGDQQHANISGG